jgi:threonylcarbamoyladenosine tRNA methylthiotransferase MtaB
MDDPVTIILESHGMEIPSQLNTYTSPPTVFIETHGCKLNSADSQDIAGQFVSLGCIVVDDVLDADIYVLNTCTVTQQADTKARKALRAAGRTNPAVVLSATGCYVERRPGEVLQVNTQAGTPIVLGNTDKSIFASEVLKSLLNKTRNPNNPLRLSAGSEALHRTRSMIKIQEGCNQVCAYCIVPKVRGRERSMPLQGLIARASQLGSEGVSEIVLTGTQLGTYGHEFSDLNLGTLLKALSKVPNLMRIRVSSLQAHEITPDLLALWDEKMFCPHFHIPLQSGSDRILRSMRRRYTAQQFRNAVALIRESVPEASITTDVIVGFPGELASDFDATYQLCQELKLNKIHVFPYSIRPGTSAVYKSDHIELQLIKSRSKELRLLSKNLERRARLRLRGVRRVVLWESSQVVNGEMIWSGLTEDYVRVSAICNEDMKGKMTPVEFISSDQIVIVK